MGTIFFVATPIGNREDITYRAVRVLKEVDVILCEDTRVTKKLLDFYTISKPLISYHHHSTARAIKEIKNLLEQGKNMALVTDAGTPGISDPGNELIHALLPFISRVQSVQDTGESIHSVPIPGPSSAVAALSVAGFPTDKFLFLGFPPHKNKRKQFFETVAQCEYTTVFFESSHRVSKCLTELAEVLTTERQVVICRELTKMFETIYRGTARELQEAMREERGEFVLVVAGKN